MPTWVILGKDGMWYAETGIELGMLQIRRFLVVDCLVKGSIIDVKLVRRNSESLRVFPLVSETAKESQKCQDDSLYF